MADAVTTQTIIDGERNCVMKFTNVSDGTGESAVAKVDVSALATNAAGQACSEVRIMRISHAIVGMSVHRLCTRLQSDGSRPSDRTSRLSTI